MLLRWILMVFDLIDDQDKLRNLYGVFFHYIDYESMVIKMKIEKRSMCVRVELDLCD